MADEPREADNAPEPADAQNPPDLASVPDPEKAVESMEQTMQTLEAETGGSVEAGQPSPLAVPPIDGMGPGGGANGAAEGMELLDDVSLRVQIELGRTLMYVEDVLRLNTDSVIELDKAAGDPVDIFVNNRKVARGEVLVVNDNFCVRVSEIIGDNADAEAEAGTESDQPAAAEEAAG
jgi:flagellar motor switch protein FliN/FliY